MLLEKAQWKGRWAISQLYIEDSMTAGGLSAIKSFEKLKLTIDHNESEGGQMDRTLAHALERLINVQYLSRNKIVKTLPGEHHSL